LKIAIIGDVKRDERAFIVIGTEHHLSRRMDADVSHTTSLVIAAGYIIELCQTSASDLISRVGVVIGGGRIEVLSIRMGR